MNEEENGRHVVRLVYRDGGAKKPISWCGKELNSFDWVFVDVQHLVNSVGGSIAPCKCCIKEIQDHLNQELDD